MTDTAEPSPPSPKARRRRRRRAILIVLLLATVWLTRWVYLHLTLRPTPRPEYWAEQIEKLDPPPAGADSFENAMRRLERVVSNARESYIQVPNVTGWSFLREARPRKVFHGTFLPLRREILDVARRGFRSEDIAQVDSMATWSRLKLGLLPCVSLLMDHARWSLAHTEGASAAVEDWLAIARLARNFERSRRYLGRYAASNLHLTLAYAMSTWALEAPLTPGPNIQTAALTAELDGLMGTELLPQQLCEGERLVLLNALERLYVREGGDWLDVSEAARWNTSWGPTGPGLLGGGTTAPSRAWNLLAPVFHDLFEAKRVVGEQFWYPDTAVTLPAVADSPGGVDRRFVGPLEGFQGYYAYPLETAVSGYYSSRCGMEGAMTLLALREFRLANGQFPATLDELVPAFLSRLPVDYGDRGVLRYKRRDGEVVLYSVGWNGVDDGGQSDVRSNRFGREGPDIVFGVLPEGGESDD